MAGANTSKLNQLLVNWPLGTVAVAPWLEKQGIYQQLAYDYEKSGWLRKIGRGAYVRLNDKLDWPGGLYAIQQQLGRPIHIGAKSALELKGLGVFSQGGTGAFLYLFGPWQVKPPTWFMDHDWGRKISYKMFKLFDGKTEMGLTSQSFDSFEIKISTPERAILELLYLAPHEQSIEEAMLIMEGLGTLRVGILQELLNNCRSIKVKRLFFALADQCNHSWFKNLDLKQIDMGSGKRSIVKDGTLDPKYQITLPKDLVTKKHE